MAHGVGLVGGLVLIMRFWRPVVVVMVDPCGGGGEGSGSR